MTKIVFYILNHRQTRLLFACELIEKLYQKKYPILILTPDQNLSDEIDRTLFTFHDTSFIPHEINHQHDQKSQLAHTVLIDTTINQNINLIVNMTDQILPTAGLKEMIEVIASDPASLQLGRDKYRQYKKNGCVLNTINMLENMDNNATLKKQEH